eukprot:15404303-Alexandrium_andersonii.AAC.1
MPPLAAEPPTAPPRRAPFRLHRSGSVDGPPPGHLPVGWRRLGVVNLRHQLGRAEPLTRTPVPACNRGAERAETPQDAGPLKGPGLWDAPALAIGALGVKTPFLAPHLGDEFGGAKAQTLGNFLDHSAIIATVATAPNNAPGHFHGDALAAMVLAAAASQSQVAALLPVWGVGRRETGQLDPVYPGGHTPSAARKIAAPLRTLKSR